MPAARSAEQVPELDPSFYDQVPAGESTTDHDFDAWWSQHALTRPTTTILGVSVPIPSQVPAEIMLNPDRVKMIETSDADEMIRLLVLMLDLTGIDGRATLDGWMAAGMGSEQLAILFTWALINGMRPAGKPAVSFARIAKVIEEGEAGGKAPAPTNRAGRRAAASPTAAGSKTKTPQRRTAGRR